MGRGIAISPVNTRQVCRRVMNKGHIQGELKSGNHKAAEVKRRKTELKQMAMAAKNEHIMLQDKMYQRLYDAVEEPQVLGVKLNTAI